MSVFSPWGGLGGPGEACVKCGGKKSTRGAHAPTGGLRQKGGTCVLLEVTAYLHGCRPRAE